MKNLLLRSICMLIFSISNGQELEKLIDEALVNSPEIQKYELQYDIASEKIKEVNSLPDTEFGVGYFASEPETRTGAQRFRVSAKQMLPWFGSITARENYISSLAEAKYEDIVIAKRKLIASVAQSYYSLFALKAKQDVLADNIKLLQSYEKLALTSVEVGKASTVDVLRLQIRQNEMNQLFNVLEQQFLAEQTNFNKLLNRESTTKVIFIEKLSIEGVYSIINVEDLKVHPELAKYDKLYKSVGQSELLNQKESNPMLGFGIDYVAVTERPNMTFSDNGKDIVMPMVSLSIPIFNKKYKSVSRQNEIKQQEILAEKQERLNKLETTLDMAIKSRIAAKISHDTQTKNLTQAKYAEEILIKSYESGTIDFNDVLDIQELQLKFQINQIESVKNYYMQTTIVNYLTQ